MGILEDLVATFYFDAAGNPVAFKTQSESKFLFDLNGTWIGWFPWGDGDAVDKDGDYLGSAVENRLLYRTSQPYRGYPGHPGYPGFAGYPGYPGFAGYFAFGAGYAEIPKNRLKG
ncbi:hypothetical protein ACIPVK_19080 [Paeniglutamicibacter sp. MACA_103]|uniref:hypothetical protein n=1 Tax=Paeniglutamicibacter sp. MACA_103 TaxID=3377337 RepID=UPI003893DE9C